MAQILKPSDFAQRIKAGETRDQIFLDASGARKAKLVGVDASMAVGDGRTIDFTISTGALDRYNSTIAVDGWVLDAFKKNGVVLWAHDDSIPAIARAENVRVEGGQLRSLATFADRDTHPLADTIYQLIKGKFIQAASVGWIPLEWKYVEERDRGFGVDYLKQELLEWSVVNIPANPECLVGARSMGIDTKPIMLWAQRALDQGGMLLIPRTELQKLRRAAGAPTLVPVSTRSDSGDWKCGAARDLAIVDDDSWDGPAAEKAIFTAYGFDGDEPDTSGVRKCFLAYNASEPKLKGSYKLPFAKIVDGKPKASAAGIRAAASRLPDTDVPQSVKDSARAVLDHYESKMGDGDKAFAESAAALKTLFMNKQRSATQFADELIAMARAFVAEARAGRVLSEDNETALQAGHDHCMSAMAQCKAAMDHCNAACDHVRGVIEQNKKKPDDGDGDEDPEDQDPDETGNENEAAAREKRLRRLRLLKLSGSTSSAAIAAATSH